MGWIGAEFAPCPRPTITAFQSLRGFGVDWSLTDRGAGRITADVSIPERVWGGLER
ncbi:hypothetical protein GFS31_43900 (plasmid) [Leptolyngbya sp. BL0902]|nr:hypothetical protein GFS31_43900 [Leptolyngbya sp. BL0902]